MSADPTQLGEIRFVNRQEQEYFAEAVVGEEVRQFLTSQAGKFLHGCARAEYDRCRDELFLLDLYTQEGKKRCQQLKADAWAASHFMQWCAEAMQNGDNAAVMLEATNEDR